MSLLENVSKEFMLTTTDNPFNPFTEFKQWYTYDECILRHKTYSTLARMVYETNDLSDKDEDEMWNRAIERFLIEDHTNLYKLVYDTNSKD